MRYLTDEFLTAKYGNWQEKTTKLGDELEARMRARGHTLKVAAKESGATIGAVRSARFGHVWSQGTDKVFAYYGIVVDDFMKPVSQNGVDERLRARKERQMSDKVQVIFSGPNGIEYGSMQMTHIPRIGDVIILNDGEEVGIVEGIVWRINNFDFCRVFVLIQPESD